MQGWRWQTCPQSLRLLPKSCLLLAELQERDAFLSIYPQGYHKTDKMVRCPSLALTCDHSRKESQGHSSHLLVCPAAVQGRPVYIQHIGAIKIKQLAEITTEDRMIRFHVQVWCGLAATIQQQCPLCAAVSVSCSCRTCNAILSSLLAKSWPPCPDMQEYERCLKYIFPSCSKKAGRHIDQTFAIMDVKVCCHMPFQSVCSKQER